MAKFFITIGAFTLALTGFFATKASNKKSIIFSGHFINTSGTDIANGLSGYTINFTISASGKHKVWIAKTYGYGGFIRLATLFTGADRYRNIYH